MTAALALCAALKEAREALRQAKARRHQMRSELLLATVEVISARADVLACAAELHEAESVAARALSPERPKLVAATRKVTP